MKSKVLVPALALSLALFGAGFAPNAAKAANGQLTISSKTIYSGESAEGKFVRDWIRSKSPAYAPMLSGGTIEVTRTGLSQINAVASRIDGPPTPLPSGGTEGQEITITYRQPNGDIETWAYTYHSGGWEMVEYHIKIIISEPGDKPDNFG